MKKSENSWLFNLYIKAFGSNECECEECKCEYDCESESESEDDKDQNNKSGKENKDDKLKKVEQTFLKPIFLQQQVKLNDKKVLQDADFFPQFQQNIHPYSNTVVLRVKSEHSDPKLHLGLGSGIIVTIGNTKYIAAVCHLFYKNLQWYETSAFLKKESKPNQLRKYMQIKKQMIYYQEQYINRGSQQNQIVFVEIQPSLYDYVRYNNQLQIRFDWNLINQQQVYLMAFPFKQNKKKQDMKQIHNTVTMHLLVRKLKGLELRNKNKILTYQTSTESGQSGGALMIYSKKEDKYYLIGLHLGGNQLLKQYNVGVLFTSELKQKFPHIFKKRDRPKTSQQDDSSFQQMGSPIKKKKSQQNNENKSQNLIWSCLNFFTGKKVQKNQNNQQETK